MRTLHAQLLLTTFVLACGSGGGGGTGGGNAAGGTGTAGGAGVAGGSATAGGSGTTAGGSGNAGGAVAQRMLTVTVTGTGRVTSAPAGIDCPGVSGCSAMFGEGTPVTLTAEPLNGWVFTGWSGGPCSGRAATCMVTLGADTTVTATFALVAVGANPRGVAVTPDGSKAYVVLNANQGQVKIVDLADYSVSPNAIAVGTFPVGISITPDGTKALVSNRATISVIDLATNMVTATISSPCVADTLYELAITPDSTRAVTTFLSGGCTQNTFAVISLATNTFTTTPLMTNAVPQGVAVTPDGASAIVTTGVTTTSVLRVSLANGAVTTIPNTSSSFGVAMRPGTMEALVSSGGSDTIKRISLATNSVTGNIMFESNSDFRNIAVTPDGGTAVVVGGFSTGVLSLSSGTVTKTWPTGGSQVAVTPDGRRALVTLGGNLRVFTLP